MTNSELFIQAHKLTKEIIETGDSYSATFGLCLSFVINESKKEDIKVEHFNNNQNNITVMTVINNKSYSLELFDDETKEERVEEFIAEYSKTTDTLKASELIETYITSNKLL